MKEQYGIGGQSHVLLRADNSYADYDEKDYSFLQRKRVLLWETM